jgi:amino acid permease
MQPDPEIYELTVELEHRTEAGERRDAEDFEEDPVEDEERPERFTLNRRQIQMMALGSSIGTGVFYGSGLLLQTAGPGSLFLGFIFSGTVMYSVMITIGEMISTPLQPGLSSSM